MRKIKAFSYKRVKHVYHLTKWLQNSSCEKVAYCISVSQMDTMVGSSSWGFGWRWICSLSHRFHQQRLTPPAGRARHLDTLQEMLEVRRDTHCLWLCTQVTHFYLSLWEKSLKHTHAHSFLFNKNGPTAADIWVLSADEIDSSLWNNMDVVFNQSERFSSVTLYDRNQISWLNTVRLHVLNTSFHLHSHLLLIQIKT